MIALCSSLNTTTFCLFLHVCSVLTPTIVSVGKLFPTLTRLTYGGHTTSVEVLKEPGFKIKARELIKTFSEPKVRLSSAEFSIEVLQQKLQGKSW
jgi:hypothetical protein